MSLKLKRSQVERIVREELLTVMREMLGEAGDEKEKEKDPEVGGAEKDNDNVDPSSQAGNKAPKVGAKAPDAPVDSGDTDVPDEEVPVGDDPADDDLEAQVDDEDEPEGGDISDDIVGKQVQSISSVDDSEMMPGAKEVVIQFEGVPNPLRILIGKSGTVKYHYKGRLFNSL